jgi:hypothetical protein
MYQQLWEYKVEEKLYLGVREQKRLNTTAIAYVSYRCLKKFSGMMLDGTMFYFKSDALIRQLLEF